MPITSSWPEATPAVSASGTITACKANRNIIVEGPVDVSLLNRASGQFVNNTNAALGTLGAAVRVVCRGASANSWKLSADTSKTY
jgi:hypothetical protein